MNFIKILLVLIAITGCKKENFVGVRETDRAKAAGGAITIAPQVDFLFIIDDSQSMNQVQTELQRGMQNFINTIQTTEASAWDIRIAAITTTNTSNTNNLYPHKVYANKGPFNFPLTNSTADLSVLLSPGVGSNASNWEMGLLNGALFLENFKSLALRPYAKLIVVVISDENDFSGQIQPRPGFVNPPPVPYQVSQLATRYTAAKGDGDLIKFISVVPHRNTSCDALRLPNPSIGERYIQMSGIFASSTIDICNGVSESVPVARVIEVLRDEVQIIREEILMNYIVLAREPRIIDEIKIDGKVYETGFKFLGYKTSFNISSGVTTSGTTAPTVNKTGYVIQLPEGVQYTSRSVIEVKAHYATK